MNLSITNKRHLKCDVIDGSVLNGVTQPILYSSILDKVPDYKIFSEPEIIHFRKINKSVLNTITKYLEDDNKEEVGFNREPLTFTIQMIKINIKKRILSNLKAIVTVSEEDTDLVQ